MLFCIDIGNTNILLGVTNENTLLKHWRIRTEKDVTSDELGILVNTLFQSAGIKMGDVKDTIVSCVVPPLINTIEEFCLRYLNTSPMIVGPGIKTGMQIKYDNPKEVGADRIVNAVGAYEKYHTALVVVDFGTATTFDYISSEGEYMGGAIAPGVLISCEALFQKASKLPRVEIFARPKSVLAKDTISSMNVGIIYGYAGLVDGIVNRMKKESAEALTVVATGGLAPIICDVSETIDHVEEFLTLQGLMSIFKKNQ
ncbi:MAG: type III pantothenate kinase [Deltaproteobacteria bacterium]|nr:type III pantothenate kinase [Deltaproteobacteria bacterium]MBW1736635.1 type III pantothenate kinase [Deltaproteobacteria bacterium]MBW1908856.1 type III pantothenate kinase [Deltaproteobacteria bacterium]MBW2114192.1 type III pantothenate kinase [Deltaproteobacteria bacterium]MBW2359194.1 type III pantothenate kinase [Deltaproteobacteria bacterium]